MHESELIAETGDSRTPIREALNRLEQENLVVILPKKGVMVSHLSPSEMSNILEVRLLIEPYLLSTYGSSLSEPLLKKLRQKMIHCHEKGDHSGIYTADDSLHKMIIDASNNPFFIDYMQTIYDQLFRIRNISMYTEQNMTDTVEEHVAIIDQILDAQIEKACITLTAHLKRAYQSYLETLLKFPQQTP